MRFPAWFALSLVLVFPNSRLPAQTTISAEVVQGWKLWNQGNPKAAIAFLETLVRQKQPTLSDVDAGLAWNVMGSAWYDLQSFDKAQRSYEMAIRLLRPVATSQAQYASAIDNLGNVEQTLGQFDSSRALREKALRIYEEVGDHTGIAIVSNNLAILAIYQKDFKAARRWLARAVEESSRTELHEDKLAARLSVEGALAAHDGRYQDAISAFQRAIDLLTHMHGPDFYGLAAAYSLLADVFAKTGDLEKATSNIQHALAIIDRTIGRNTIEGIRVQIAYAQVLRASGSKGEASRMEKQSRKALAELEQHQCSGCTINVASFH